MLLCSAFSRVTSNEGALPTYLYFLHIHTHTNLFFVSKSLFVICLRSLAYSGFLEYWIIFYLICNTIVWWFYVRSAVNTASFPRVLSYGPCGFRPFDFYSKLKIEKQKFTIVIFSVCFLKNWKSQIYNLNCQFLFLRNIKLKNNFQCFKNQKLKIENGQLVDFNSCF